MNRTTQTVCLTFISILSLFFLISCSNPPLTPTPTAISPTLTATTPPTPDTIGVAETNYQATLSIKKTQDATSLVTSTVMMTATSQAPSSTLTPTPDTSEPRTGVDELDRIIQIGLDSNIEALQSLIRYLQVKCTFDDGLGGFPKCKDGEAEGQIVEVLPVLAGEGHFIRRDDIDSWVGIDGTDLYAVYSVSDSVFSDPIYPSGEYAIAFINEARFMISILHIVEGQIVRADYAMGNPPIIRPDDVHMYLIAPRELDQ